jgi:site-specific DNA recombinase
LYLGEMVCKGQSFAGQHQSIVTQELWDSVHAFIERRKHGPREHRTEHAVLLAGLLFAPDGQRMLHTSTQKKSGRIYRYYVPYLHKRRNAGATLDPSKPEMGPLPAAEIEMAVLKQIHATLSAPEMLVSTWQACQRRGSNLDEAQVVVAMRQIGRVWEQLFPAEQQRIARLLIERVQLHAHGLDIRWRDEGWQGLGADVTTHPLVEESRSPTEKALA